MYCVQNFHFERGCHWTFNLEMSKINLHLSGLSLLLGRTNMQLSYPGDDKSCTFLITLVFYLFLCLLLVFVYLWDYIHKIQYYTLVLAFLSVEVCSHFLWCPVCMGRPRFCIRYYSVPGICSPLLHWKNLENLVRLEKDCCEVGLFCVNIVIWNLLLWSALSSSTFTFVSCFPDEFRLYVALLKSRLTLVVAPSFLIPFLALGCSSCCCSTNLCWSSYEMVCNLWNQNRHTEVSLLAWILVFLLTIFLSGAFSALVCIRLRASQCFI